MTRLSRIDVYGVAGSTATTFPIFPIDAEHNVSHRNGAALLFVYDPEPYWDGWSDPWREHGRFAAHGVR